MLMDIPGLAGAARAARASGLSWAASGTTVGLRRTCSQNFYEDDRAKLQGQGGNPGRFASKGRTPPNSIE